MNWLFLALTSLTLLSCAHMDEASKNQCASYSWEKKGAQDALEGEKPDSIDIDYCTRFGVTGHKEAYMKGYTNGLAQFCTYERGIYFGREGKEYNNTCTPSVANKFLSGYSKGKMEYQQLEAMKEQTEALKQQGDQCNFNSDCKIKMRCEYVPSESVKRCGKSGKTCNFDSDCEIEGSCFNSKCSWN